MTQQNTISLQSFYKDHLFDNSSDKVYSGSSFLPVLESEYNLNFIIRDSSKQYYDFTETLFKKHLFDLAGKNYHLTISPIFDFTLGKDIADTANRRLFQNTRGLFVEGDLLKNFSFSTSVYENQARFNNYESSYYSSIGELYPQGNHYVTQNAVIPGSGRTKPFKIDGFDYAYAIGNIIYRPIKSVALVAGNSSHFVGDGYRSILLSDNGAPAPFLRAIYRISQKWELNYLRMRLFNLMRKPASTTVEAYYETKNYSSNYLTYKINKRFSISLFEGVVWSKGDSIVSKHVNPLYYSPIPFLPSLILSNKEVNALHGLSVSLALKSNHRIYSQFAVSNLTLKNAAFQLGYRGYNYFGMKNFMLQLEYNNVGENTYSSSNARLNYSQYNLPMAHVKGNAFQELLIRSNFEYKRLFVELKINYFLLKNYQDVSLLGINKNNTRYDGNILTNQVEFGYRFNRLMNFSVYCAWLGRFEKTDLRNSTTNQFTVGIRTAINNHYNDF
jgi:hypothetical protein